MMIVSARVAAGEGLGAGLEAEIDTENGMYVCALVINKLTMLCDVA